MIQMQKIPQNFQSLPPVPAAERAADMADLFRLALNGWVPAGAGAGLEALFDRMEAVR